ncbi:MAG: rod shape-determining protein MreC [Ghiorsea sp.]
MSVRHSSGYRSHLIWWGAAFLIIFLLSFKFPVGQKLGIAIAPILHVVQAPVRWLHDFSLWFDNNQLLQQELIALRESKLQQQTVNQELSTLREENHHLRALLNITQIEGFIWHASRVISRGQEEKSRRLMVQTNAVAVDDVVISHEGLVGLVDDFGLGHASVRTILDASIAVPVTMKNSNLAALVRGDGGHLLVDFVPVANAPKIDDVLITSGAGGLFPAGLAVAVVEQVKPVAGGVFAEVIARPAAYWKRDAWLAVASRTTQ